MPKEIPELPTSRQEVQIQPPNLLDKIKIHKFKILAGVLGILVFAGAVFGAYKFGQRQIQPALGPTPTPVVVATPTPDPTANWKTYMNTKYDFEIKYPPDWSFNEEMSRFTPKEENGGYIQIRISSNATRGVTPCELNRSSCNFVIDEKIFGERTKSATRDEIFFPGIFGEHDMNITLYKGEKDYGLIFNFMLSTFKFIE